jgi:hypothetical protein
MEARAKDCIYTWCVMPKDIYLNTDTLDNNFRVVGMSEYMVEDPYNGDSEKISNFIKGYWLETFESAVKNKQISEEFFGTLLKQYCKDNIAKYPELIVGTSIIYQKGNN